MFHIYTGIEGSKKKKLNYSLPLGQTALKICLPWASLSLPFFTYWKTTSLCPCLMGNWEWKMTSPAGKSTPPGQPDSNFLEPCGWHQWLNCSSKYAFPSSIHFFWDFSVDFDEFLGKLLKKFQRVTVFPVNLESWIYLVQLPAAITIINWFPDIVLTYKVRFFCMSIYFNFQAIDKELELKEGFENYSSPHQRPAPVAKPWSHPMIQQQQQQPGKLCNQNQTTSKLTRVRS